MKVIVTGATGMVGEGVLHECLQHPDITGVLSVSRRPSGLSHPKLKELLHADFFDLSPVAAELEGYDGCFFCLGVSSVGMKEADYHRMTYELTMHMARTLADRNREMVFCYVSGAGTDSTEKGRSMWARVKGKTENSLQQLPFKNVYAFRPGFIQPTKGLKNTLGFYKYVGWLFPVLKRFGWACTLREIGLAMINAMRYGYPQKVLEVKDIVALAGK